MANINELITTQDEFHKFYNKLTEELDSSLSNDIKKYNLKTYIVYEEQFQDLLLIRHPGATRGCIKIDRDNIIIDICIYEDSNIYGTDIEEKIKEYIGSQIIFV